tara:strand:+ start:41 stop:949 length:909 start_codon:yes stop_codon:yes gene_type:complete
MVDKSIAKSIYDKVSKDDRSIVKMFVDYLSKKANKNKSTAKVIVDFLSNNPDATVTKNKLTEVANKAKSAAKPLLTPKSNEERKGLEFTKKTKAELLATLDWETKRKQTARDNAAVEKMEEQQERKRAIGKSKRFRPAPLPAQTVDKLTAVPAKTPTPLPLMKPSKPVVKAKLNNGKVTVSSTSNDVSSEAINKANKELKDKDGLTEGKFGTRAGTAAIKSFFRDTLGIEKDIEVDYTFPGEEGYGTPPEDRPKKTQSKKSGGKVTAKRTPTKRAAVKRPTTKKYAMNRGGKVASVRKPTRA